MITITVSYPVMTLILKRPNFNSRIFYNVSSGAIAPGIKANPNQLVYVTMLLEALSKLDFRGILGQSDLHKFVVNNKLQMNKGAYIFEI